MYRQGGVAYIYLCYGIHHLFNVVSNSVNVPHAILIRGLEPKYGIDTMIKRRKLDKFSPRLTNGPGSLSKALGINTSLNGLDLTGNTIWIEDRNEIITEKEIISSPRVGVESAGTDAKKPWRFRIFNNPFCSPVN